MEEISIRKYQQESGERPFQFTEIEGSDCRVPPLLPPLFPNSSQKMSCFLSPRLFHHLPLPAQGEPLDAPQACGAAHDGQACILGH